MRLGSRPVATLLIVMVVLLALPLSAVSLVALRLGERLILPELDAKAESVGRAAAARIELALSYDLPLERLVGMEDFLGALRADAGTIAYIAVSDPVGQVLYASGEQPERLSELLVARTVDPGATAGDGLVSRFDRLIDNLLVRLTGDRLPELSPGQELGPYIDAAVPVRLEGTRIAAVHVGVPSSFVRERLNELLLDVAIVGFVALLVAFELLLLVLTLNFSGPLTVVRHLLTDIADGRFTRTGRLRSRDEIGRLVHALNSAILRVNGAYRELLAAASEAARRGEESVRGTAEAVVAQLSTKGTFLASGPPAAERPPRLVVIRPLAFLFVLAEELARPFLPVYIESFAAEVPYGTTAFLTGLPISAFMLVAALSMLGGGAWSDRVGRRPTFAAGALLATAGLAGTALAPDFWWLMGARLMAGIGYGLAFVACQGYVIDRTGPADRSQGVAMFVGGIMAADICGPAIGGILADRIGFTATLLLGAGVAAVAAVLAFVLLEGQDPEHETRRGSVLKGVAAAVGNWRFDAVVLFAGLPAKLLLTGFLFYLAPLLLTELGTSQSEIGRVVMTYGIAAFLLAPLFARMADRLRVHGLMVCGGGIISGLTMLPILFVPSPGHVVLAVVGLGVGQAMSIASLLAIVTRVSARELHRVGQAPVLGAFRLLERLGAAAGPFVAAAGVATLGLAGTMAALGAFSVLTAVLFGTIFLIAGYEPEPVPFALDPDEAPGGLKTFADADAAIP